VTQVVLSFLGQQAPASLLPPARLRDLASQGFLERAKIEQAELGLCAGAIGELLMRAWALPPNVSDEVRDIDRVLTTPAQAFKAQRGARLALCYLSARLGERLASGELRDFAAFDLAAEQSPEFFSCASIWLTPNWRACRNFWPRRNCWLPPAGWPTACRTETNSRPARTPWAAMVRLETSPPVTLKIYKK